MELHPTSLHPTSNSPSTYPAPVPEEDDHASSTTSPQATSIAAAAPSRARRPSVSNACERCRRRKIRCDDNVPCATCARFRLNCVKQGRQRDRSRSTQNALEERIRRLELQLDRAQQPHPLEDPSGLPLWVDSMETVRPELRLDTNVDSLSSSYSGTSDDVNLYDLSAGVDNSPSIPTIEVTQFDHHLNTLSPQAWSPSPSLVFSSSSRASTPDPIAVSTPLLNACMPTATGLTPSLNPSFSPQSDEFSSFLSAGSASAGPSRRSSLSSDVFIPDDMTTFKTEPQFLSPSAQALGLSDTVLQPPPPQLSPPGSAGFEFIEHALPTLDQANSILRAYFFVFPPSNMQASFDTFRALIQAFYSLPSPVSSQPIPPASDILAATSLGPNMARFQLFMTLAVGLKLAIRQRRRGSQGSHVRPRSNSETSNPEIATVSDEAMMNCCYQVAMAQVHDTGTSFWDLNGGIEAGSLMLQFAMARGQP